MGMIPGFDFRLNLNFNHFMYADDLILATKTTRQAARNTNFCLSIYAQLSGQKPNVSKSVVF